ncbi:MAG: restriction endonuclease subunit S, partial [Eubacteriales bacterium]|nr:restriction endonuclease subunit S [Eubacteriales bacterium]
MARTAKKESVLTLEEKLAQVLVPEEGRPYHVPRNWCWIHLLDSFDNHTDSKKKIQQKDYLEEGSLAIVDQGQEIVGGYSDDDEMRYTGTLPVIIFGDHTRCIKYVDFPFAQGADGVKVLAPKECFLPKAFFYALHSIDIPNMGYRRHYPLFKNYSIPVPPLAEQQRIVARIESLFAKLDEAKEKAHAVVDGFEDRKAAILHKAFSGELTADWRRNNHITTDQWNTKSFSSVTENHDSKRIPLSKEERANLERKYDYYGASGVIDQVDRYIFDGKYLLIGEDGANLVTRSKPIAFIAEGQYWVNNHAHILTTSQDMVMEFLCYYINSISLLPYVTGSAQPKMTQAKMNTIPVPVPSIEEQIEIVQVLNNLIEKQEQASDAADQVIEQIDSMKKAILARAFRG